jgi:Stage II sporulation protein E (SpoIIE)
LDGFTLTLASGGRPASLLVRANGIAGYASVSDSPCIGVFDDTVFTAATIRLEPGDVLLLYTDGVGRRVPTPIVPASKTSPTGIHRPHRTRDRRHDRHRDHHLARRVRRCLDDDITALALSVPRDRGLPSLDAVALRCDEIALRKRTICRGNTWPFGVFLVFHHHRREADHLPGHGRRPGGPLVRRYVTTGGRPSG